MIIDIPNVGRVEFPDSMGKAQINAAAKRLYEQASGGQGSEVSQPGYDFSLGEMIKNIPSSGMQAGKQLYDVVRHPLSTIQGLGNLAVGAAEKLIPGTQGKEQYANAVGQAVMDRYGSFDAFKRTAEQDPVGALLDVGSVLTGAGGLLRTGTKAGSLANRAARAAQMIGAKAEPVSFASGAVKAAAGRLPRGAAATLYERAAKWPPVTGGTQAQRVVKTEAALQHQIMPSQRGLEKANAILAGFDDTIDALVKQADKSGQLIPKKDLYKHIDELQARLSEGAAGPKNLAQSKSVVNALKEQLKTEPKMLKPSRVQKFKVATYQDINWKKRTPGARAETYKALATGAKESIADLSPALADINAQYGPLRELASSLPQAINRIGNRDPLSLSRMILGSAGVGAGGGAGGAAGLAIGSINSPQSIARAALAIRRAQDAGLLENLAAPGWIAPYGVPAIQGMYQAGNAGGLLPQ